MHDVHAPSGTSDTELRAQAPQLSVVVPMHNEEGNVGPFLNAVHQSLEPLGLAYEILLVDDGSTDATWRRIVESTSDRRVRGLSLSRNFGHQSALFAGIHNAHGDAVVTMDGDLQHPPRVIPELLAAWREGYKVVNTQRKDSADTTLFKRLTSRWFYRVFARLSGVPMQPGSSDFRLMDRTAVDQLAAMSDSDLFIRGLVSWLGYRTKVVPFQADSRLSGTTKYNLRKMIRFSLTALLSFSALPLKLGIWLGFMMSTLAFAEITYIFVQYARGVTVPGWASVMTFLSLMFGILFVLIGVLGTYLGKIYEIIKGRPRFIVAERAGFREP